MEWGPRSSGVGFFCFHALGDTKQKKPTPLDRGPPLHVNRVFNVQYIVVVPFSYLTFILLYFICCYIDCFGTEIFMSKIK